MHTREQKYAQQAFEQVKQVPDAQRDGYKTAAQELPILIRTAGLAQALAFSATQDDGRKQLLDHLAVLMGIQDAQCKQPREALLKRTLAADLGVYTRLTQQALDALLWYKRFAEALFEADRKQS
jgi:CRISPR-associated protein Cmr5